MSIVKKRYFYLLHPVYHVFAALIVIIMLAAFLVNVLRLSDAAGLTSYNHPLDITSCVVTVLAAALLSSFVWGSGYTLGKSALYINLCQTRSLRRYSENALGRKAHRARHVLRRGD